MPLLNRAFVATVLLIALGAVAYVSFVRVTPATNNPLSGHLYLTTATKDTFIPVPVALDLATGASVTPTPGSSLVSNFDSFSADGSLRVFVGISKAALDDVQSGVSSLGEALQVYVAPATNSSLDISGEQAVTRDGAIAKLEPAISPSGVQIAYMTRTEATSTYALDTYATRILDRSGTGTTTLVGAHPHWFDDDRLFYLSPDGLRSYAVSTGASTLILPLDAAANQKFSLSKDGRYLLFADPDSHSVFIFGIGDRTHPETSLTPLATLPVLGYWALMSPDNQYVAVQSALPDGTPYVAFFDAQTGAEVGTRLILSGISNDRLFMTAWER